MIDTIKVILTPAALNYTWDINDLKTRLKPFEKYHRKDFKPIGFIKNISISGNNNYLIVEGSLAKYFSENNLAEFNWKYVKPAIRNLSMDLGLNIERGYIMRIDIAANFIMDEEVANYFPELKHLRYFDPVRRKKTTLAFNSDSTQVKFYDKLAEAKRKLIQDADVESFGNLNLMRYELSLLNRLNQQLKMKRVRAVQLYNPNFYTILLNHWYGKYQAIEKKSVLVFPPKLKGRTAIEKLMQRHFVESVG